jgi:hypothetical protein
MPTKSKFFCSKIHVRVHQSSKLLRSHKTVKNKFFLIYLLVDGRSRIRTNNYGSWSGRPKNVLYRYTVSSRFLSRFSLPMKCSSYFGMPNPTVRNIWRLGQLPTRWMPGNRLKTSKLLVSGNQWSRRYITARCWPIPEEGSVADSQLLTKSPLLKMHPISKCSPVLTSFADPGWLYRILDPNFSISVQGSERFRIRINFSTFYSKKIVSKP